jgi:hypothetical protein
MAVILDPGAQLSEDSLPKICGLAKNKRVKSENLNHWLFCGGCLPVGSQYIGLMGGRN